MDVTGELPPDVGNYAWAGFNPDYADMYMYKEDGYYVSGGATLRQHPPGAPAGMFRFLLCHASSRDAFSEPELAC